VQIAAVMVTCPERAADSAATIADFVQTDFGSYPEVIVDDGPGPTSLERIRATWKRALTHAASIPGVDLVLMLEDDIRFNRFLRHNIEAWRPVRAREIHLFASLYHNVGRFGVATRAPPRDHYLVAIPHFSWGSQAVLMARPTLRWIVDKWDTVPGNPDERMPALAGDLTRILVHVPSLVQHVGRTTWGFSPHHAEDFDAEFRDTGGPPWTFTTR
jgi:hypothetical protein